MVSPYFFLKKVMDLFTYRLVTTLTLPPSPPSNIVCPVFFINSAAKNNSNRVSPVWMMSPGGEGPLPLPVTPLNRKSEGSSHLLRHHDTDIITPSRKRYDHAERDKPITRKFTCTVTRATGSFFSFGVVAKPHATLRQHIAGDTGRVVHAYHTPSCLSDLVHSTA